MKTKSYLLTFTLLLSLLAAGGCSREGSEPPAPLGDILVLEKLAENYTKVIEQIDMNVHSMPPNERRLFLENVFRQSGYDYSKTLRAVGETRLDPFNKEQKDMVELLLIPSAGLSAPDMSDLFSKEEIKAIEHMKGTF